MRYNQLITFISLAVPGWCTVCHTAMPLQTGNRWVYHHEVAYAQDSGAVSFPVSLDTLAVTGTYAALGDTWYAVSYLHNPYETLPFFCTDGPTYYLRSDSTGVYRLETDGTPRADPLFKYDWFTTASLAYFREMWGFLPGGCTGMPYRAAGSDFEYFWYDSLHEAATRMTIRDSVGPTSHAVYDYGNDVYEDIRLEAAWINGKQVYGSPTGLETGTGVDPALLFRFPVRIFNLTGKHAVTISTRGQWPTVQHRLPAGLYLLRPATNSPPVLIFNHPDGQASDLAPSSKRTVFRRTWHPGD